MSETVYLVGSEQVVSAGRAIQTASETMRLAASEIGSALMVHESRMREISDEFLVRISDLLDRVQAGQDQQCVLRAERAEEQRDRLKVWVIAHCRPRMCGCYERPDAPCVCGARAALADEPPKEEP